MYSDTGIRLLYIAEGVELDFDNERFSINTNGLYLAVVDRGSCTSVTRISVFYYICPEQTVNLVHYPETVAPPFTNPQDREVTGVCIDNASQASADLILECKIRGEWKQNIAMCSCNPGYEEKDNTCSGECHISVYKINYGVKHHNIFVRSVSYHANLLTIKFESSGLLRWLKARTSLFKLLVHP